MAALLPRDKRFPPMTPDEEDAVIHVRINNDDRNLRRLLKKFYLYTSATSGLRKKASTSEVAEEARDAFLLDLATLSVQSRKNVLVCEAELRQIEEYERETSQITDEHEILRGQITQLKTSLEDVQLLRKRKMEYDQVAERINTLPSRDELTESIEALENDMAAILEEHETQDQELQQRRMALQRIVLDVTTLRSLGKDENDGEGTPSNTVDADMESADDALQRDGDIEKPTTVPPVHAKLNAAAPSFIPREASPTSSSAPNMAEIEEGEDDIEMGEVAELPKGKAKKKQREEELEEGEASDSSSELSEPPEE